jgi:hypothetical protein
MTVKFRLVGLRRRRPRLRASQDTRIRWNRPTKPLPDRDGLEERVFEVLQAAHVQRTTQADATEASWAITQALLGTRTYFSWLANQPNDRGAMAELNELRRERDKAQSAWDKLSDARLARYDDGKRVLVLAAHHMRLFSARSKYEWAVEAQQLDPAEPLSRQTARGGRRGPRQLSPQHAALIPLIWGLYDKPLRDQADRIIGGGPGLPDTAIHALLKVADLPAPSAREIKRLRLEYRRP